MDAWDVAFMCIASAFAGAAVVCRFTDAQMRKMHEFANDLHRENVWLRGVVANKDVQLELADEAMAKQKEIVALYEDTQ